MYTIYATDTFRSVYDALQKDEKDWVDKVKEKFKEYPTGKPLGFPWFREKKYMNKRLYFLIDEQGEKILFVAFASKKEHGEVIDFVKGNMRILLEYLKKV